MKASKLILAALVIFVAGMATGSAVSALWVKARAQANREQREQRERVPSPMSYRIDFLRRVQKELQLSEEQKVRIEGYVRESQDRLRALWEPVAPQAKAEYESLREKIRSELNPEQCARFDETLRDRSRRGDNRERRPDESGRSRSVDPKGADSK